MTDLRLRLTGRGPHSREVARLVADLALRTGLPAGPAYRLRLAADEITTNIAVHGYRMRGGPIGIEGGADPDLVWLRVEDEAPPFDPCAHRPVPEPGGYGLVLVCMSLDEFRHVYVDGRNRVFLGVRPAARPPRGRR